MPEGFEVKKSLVWSDCDTWCIPDNPRQMSRVPVYIRVLDVNDNAPTFATNYETFVCENAKANQVGTNEKQLWFHLHVLIKNVCGFSS